MTSNSNSQSFQCHSTSTAWWALYIRLSREDGDKLESLSVAHQKMKLTSYADSMTEITTYKLYIDDGWTGTNFERPGFLQLLQDIHAKKVQGIIVKDLSRLGRDNPKASYYIHDFFPSHKVRFIAIDDGIDKDYYDFDCANDMMIDVKNMFNGFYPRDISNKVRSTFRTKQSAGQFIGAFACYGYQKAPQDHNALVVDEAAAKVVRRIFSMYLSGIGQNTIAKKLNEEGIPCPSEYKRLQGLNYRNGKRLESTTYWTYSSVRNILRNEIYTGMMVQNKSFRQICKKKAMPLPREKWITVPDTHEAIIDRDTFDRVQALLHQNTRQTNLSQNVHLFAGLLRCGDCGRAMCKIKRNGTTAFCCGSYNRYGTDKCTSHLIEETVLEQIVLKDFNALLAKLENPGEILLQEEKNYADRIGQSQNQTKLFKLQAEKLLQKKERAYEDYTDGLISKEDFIRYRDHCENKLHTLEHQMAISSNPETGTDPSVPDVWLTKLLKKEKKGCLDKLSRSLVVEMVEQIYIYQNHTIKIVYNYLDE